MRRILSIVVFAFVSHLGFAQCDTTGILLELQATTDLQGILFGNNRCFTSATILYPLIVSNDTISIDTTGLGGSGIDTVKAIQPAAGLTITGSPGVAPVVTLTFALANDLLGLEGLSGVGIPARTATDTWALRTITAGAGISVADGDGVAANPTITNTGDLSTTNEIQRLDTFEIVANILRASLLNDAVPFSSVDLSPYLGTGDLLQNGNTFGAAWRAGTNDDQAASIETNNEVRATFSSGVTTGGDLTLSGTTANTTTAQDRLIIQTISSAAGTGANFGGSILFMGEDANAGTMENMVRLSAIWTTATHGALVSALVYSDVNAGALTERFRFTPSAMTIAANNYTIGNHTTNTLIIGGNTGQTIVRSQRSTQSGVVISNSHATTGGIQLGENNGFTSTALNKKRVLIGTESYTVASGTGTMTSLSVEDTWNLTGTASGPQRGIHVKPTLTSLASATYKGLHLEFNHASAFGIYQEGSLSTNRIEASTMIGALTAPARTLHITGEFRVTDRTTDTPDRIWGSDSDGDLADVTVGSGLSLSGGVLSTTGGGGLTAANNGLSVSGTTVQWGGPLIQHTTIDQASFYYLHKDGQRAFHRYEGNPFTDVNVTSSVDITGKGLSPSTSATPSEDNILCVRGHDGTSTFYGNALFFGVYTTATNGVWLKSRNEGAYTTYYPINLNPNGGQVGIGRNPASDALDAFTTISTSGLAGSGVAGSALHWENSEGNGKASATFGVGKDVADGEIGYFDATDIVRVTNRNTANLSSSIRFAIGGETSDRTVLLSSTAASNARLGVGFTNTTGLNSTLHSKGSIAGATLTTAGAPTFDETKFYVAYNGAGNQTYTLPAQADCSGRLFMIANFSAAGIITLSANVRTANGVTFNTIDPGQHAQFISDGTDFRGFKLTSE